jgi:hypothetical protein
MNRIKFNLAEQTEDKFVAFLDVLGFKELVYKNNFDTLNSYFSKLTSVLDGLREKKKNVESFVISDSIILIAPSGLQSFKELLRAIQTIQSQLIWRKIVLRGAVSYGPVYFDGEKNIIVGKGYIRAFMLEQEASYPRVIIDPAIIKLFGTDKKGFLKSVNRTEEYNFDKRLIYEASDVAKISADGTFVDYANKIITKDGVSNSLAVLYETILDNLYSEQRLFAKYTWLKDYFLECLQLTHHLNSINTGTKARVYQKELEEWSTKFTRL